MHIITVRLDTGLTSFPFDMRGIARLYIEKKTPLFNFAKNIVAYNKLATEYEEECAKENQAIIESYFNIKK